MNRKRVIFGVACAVALLILNLYQYNVLGSNSNSGQENAQHVPLLARKGMDLSPTLIADIKTHNPSPAVRDLFSMKLPKPKEAPVEPMPVVNRTPTSTQETAALVDPAALFKVLAVSKHSGGVSALISYQGSSQLIKVGDVFAGKYQVVAIEGNQIRLTVQEVSQ